MIVITTSSFGKLDASPLQRLEEAGYQVSLNPHGRTLKEAEIVDLVAGARGMIAGTEPLSRTVLEQLPALKVISRCGTGMDNVDQGAAAELGIKVYRTPDAPTQAVAELTVSVILDLLRGVSRQDRQVRAGVWRKHMGSLLRGKQVGVIGFGKIGRRVGEMLAGLGAVVSFCDPAVDAGTAGCDRQSPDALLAWSDIVTLHVAGKQRLLGRDELGQMKQGAWLVNCARGGLVDETALYDALKEGRIAGAAVDVFETEPYVGALRELDNVVLTPHIGSYAREARIEMELQAVDNLLEGLDGV